MILLSGSTTYQNRHNTTFFPVRVEIDDVDTWRKIMVRDFSPVVFKNNQRLGANFDESTLLYGDSDDGYTLEEFAERFKKYTFILATSRNHNKEKKHENGEVSGACHRFHFFFPVAEKITDGAAYATAIANLHKECEFSCPGAKDNARLLYGNKDVEIIVNRGDELYTPNFARSILEVRDDPLDKFAHMEGVGAATTELMKDAKNRKKILEALADTRDTGFFDDINRWLRLGYSLKIAGFALSDYEALSWDNADCKSVWGSMHPNGHVSAGSLIYFARQTHPGLFRKNFAQLIANDKTKRADEQNEKRSERAEKLRGSESILHELCPSDIWHFGHTRQNENGDILPKATIENFSIMLDFYGIEVYENMMNHITEVILPGGSMKEGNVANAAITRIESLANVNNFPHVNVASFVDAIAHRNQRHPFRDFVESEPWDGVDRFDDLFDCLDITPGQDSELCKIFFKKWLISQVAVLYEHEPRTRGVLTLQGGQSVGKTSFLKSLYPSGFFKDGLSLDVSSKDDRISALSYVCCELGELEGVFKRSDVASLKSFLTAFDDRYRRPYDRRAETHLRRTVFCASVNDSRFLSDTTGSTRFWIIKVGRPNYKHGMNLAQFWAQIKQKYEDVKEFELECGWWLSRSEEQRLESKNEEHTDVSIYAEQILKFYDYNKQATRILSATDIAREIGFDRPTQRDVREISSWLRSSRKFSDARMKNDARGWAMPEVRTDDEVRNNRKIQEDYRHKEDFKNDARGYSNVN